MIIAGIPNGSELFSIYKLDYEHEFNRALKYTRELQSILWSVIVDNEPATHKKMDNYRSALDLLMIFGKYK